jgi:small-conductance mechanosensitive channel
MRRDWPLAGFIGLLIGAGVYAAASVLSARLPTLVAQDGIGAAIIFAILLAFSLGEIPLMVFALRQMARSATTSRRFVLGVFVVYVAFASVYASIFVLLTGQVLWGIALAGLCVVRLASGALVQ